MFGAITDRLGCDLRARARCVRRDFHRNQAQWFSLLRPRCVMLRVRSSLPCSSLPFPSFPCCFPCPCSPLLRRPASAVGQKGKQEHDTAPRRHTALCTSRLAAGQMTPSPRPLRHSVPAAIHAPACVGVPRVVPLVVSSPLRRAEHLAASSDETTKQPRRGGDARALEADSDATRTTHHSDAEGRLIVNGAEAQPCTNKRNRLARRHDTSTAAHASARHERPSALSAAHQESPRMPGPLRTRQCGGENSAEMESTGHSSSSIMHGRLEDRRQQPTRSIAPEPLCCQIPLQPLRRRRMQQSHPPHRERSKATHSRTTM